MSTDQFTRQIQYRLCRIYGEMPLALPRLEAFIQRVVQVRDRMVSKGEKWTEKDVVLITYGDSIQEDGKKPLQTLNDFLVKFVGNAVSHVHLLPFFPYSSDDGFSVIDYKMVDPRLGNWDDIRALGKNYHLMFDLVINHVSQHSEWFQNYLQGKHPGSGYFIEADPATDLSCVVRPRSLPLLTAFSTPQGQKHVWTTFSADQIDLNFSNPEVLLAMMEVFLFYLEKGARIVRLDAIAFLWKTAGTNCLHLPQTHEVVKLMRDISNFIDPAILLLTETNVPHWENISYFGQGDEAAMVYQFSLPPMLLHALYRGTSSYLNTWAQSVSEAPPGCTYFNFTASHDGIGVRPLEGLLPYDEIVKLADAMKDSGGMVGTKRNGDGSDSPYEINITYFDAMARTVHGETEWQQQRFLCSQTLMMAFKGLPAFYIHSLLATPNNYQGVKETGTPRTINRRKWQADELFSLLDGSGPHAFILKEMLRRMGLRKTLRDFHPDASQEVVFVDDELFCMRRGSGIIVLANLTAHHKPLSILLKPLGGSNKRDVLTDRPIHDIPVLAPYQVCWLL